MRSGEAIPRAKATAKRTKFNGNTKSRREKKTLTWKSNYGDKSLLAKRWTLNVSNGTTKNATCDDPLDRSSESDIYKYCQRTLTLFEIISFLCFYLQITANSRLKSHSLFHRRCASCCHVIQLTANTEHWTLKRTHTWMYTINAPSFRSMTWCSVSHSFSLQSTFTGSTLPAKWNHCDLFRWKATLG